MSIPETFKSVTINQNLSVNIDEIPVPQPKGDEILVRIVASGVNPKDWKLPAAGMSNNCGDDIAGYVVAIGPKVTEFHVGDRVAGFHVMMADYGSFGEYGILHDYLSFHIPKDVSFESASTIPLAAITAAIGLFIDLELPTPWNPAPEGSSNPLVVYGASGNVGAFAVKLAKAANISPIIAIAGAGSDFVKTLGVDKVIDYRGPSIGEPLREFLGDQKVYNLFDAIGGEDVWKRIGDEKLVEKFGTMTTAMGSDEVDVMKKLMPNVNVRRAWCSKVQRKPELPQEEHFEVLQWMAWSQLEHFGYVAMKSIGRLLAEGRFAGNPTRVVQGQESISQALEDLMAGKASAVKYVIKIGEE